LKQKIKTLSFLIAYWGFFLCLGYPQSTVDDVFWTDAAIHLAKNNRLVAPALKRNLLNAKSDLFLRIPPFYAYSLGGWLKIFKVSTISIILFFLICYILGSWGLIEWLKTFNIPLFSLIGALVAYTPFIHAMGFRPEAFAMIFLFWGLFLLDFSTFRKTFVGTLFLECAVLTMPNVFSAVLVLSILQFYIAWKNEIKRKNLITMTIMAGTMSICVSVVILTFMIHHQWSAFFEQMQTSMSGAKINWYSAPLFFYNFYKQYWRPILNFPIYGFALIGLCLIYTISDSKPKTLVKGCFFIVIATLFFRPALMIYNEFWMWICSVICCSLLIKHKKYGYCYSGFLGMFFLIYQSLNFISFWNTERPSKTYLTEVENQIKKNEGTLVVDDIVARYVFNYQLPEGTLSLHYLRPFPNHQLTTHHKLLGDTWIVSKARIGQYIPEIVNDYPRIKILGRTFQSLPKNPFEIIILQKDVTYD
jgi:hypothetical protein